MSWHRADPARKARGPELLFQDALKILHSIRNSSMEGYIQPFYPDMPSAIKRMMSLMADGFGSEPYLREADQLPVITLKPETPGNRFSVRWTEEFQEDYDHATTQLDLMLDSLIERLKASSTHTVLVTSSGIQEDYEAPSFFRPLQ